MHLTVPPSPCATDVTAKSISMGYVILICCVAALGGLLFGFDTAVISGAIGPMKKLFGLTEWMEGFTASVALLGCAAGAFMAGMLSDRFGRKKVLILSSIFFFISAIWAAVPGTPWEFAIARIIGGLAIGIASILSPLYIAEVAPARIRGSLVAVNQLAIVFGILVAYVIDWGCLKLFPEAVAWRWMFGSGMVPALGFLMALLAVPESPRWLTSKGMRQEALAILTRVDGAAHAETEMADILATLRAEQGRVGSVMDLLRPGLRLALLIGVALAIFQQITGINTVLYYAPEILKSAGFSSSDALLNSILIGVVNLTFTMLAVLLVDRLGRKPMLILGAIGMSVALMLLGAAFRFQWSPIQILIWVLAYVGCFNLTLGPVVWVVIAEIFPTIIRGRGMAVATVLLWLSCYVVSQTFPLAIKTLGYPMTYWMYAAICIIMLGFVCSVVPETKGKTLEEIERYWQQ